MNKTKNGENMSFAVAINASGQATIPKEIRDLLGVVPGKNRLTFEVVNGKVTLGKEASRAELLQSSLRKIWANIEEEKRRNPEFAHGFEKYKGMTFNEIRETYDATPEGKRELREKYGI